MHIRSCTDGTTKDAGAEMLEFSKGPKTHLRSSRGLKAAPTTVELRDDQSCASRIGCGGLLVAGKFKLDFDNLPTVPELFRKFVRVAASCVRTHLHSAWTV
jgi:hypothetical protein